MASKRDEAPSDNLCCPVCIDTYTNPKVLPCCHTFCRGCIEKLLVVDPPPLPFNQTEESTEIEADEIDVPVGISESDDEHKVSIKCPVCKENHILESGGVDELKDDFEIRDRLEQGSIQQSLVNKQFHCFLCEEDDEVVEYCQDCTGFLCEFCARAHKKQKKYSGHRLVACNELSPEQYISPRTTTCSKHLGAEIIFFCNDCSELMCSSCVTSSLRDHRSHDFVTLEDSDKAHSERAQRMEQSCAQTLEVFRHHKDYIGRVEREFLNSPYTEELRMKINAQFDIYIRALQQRKQELLDKVDCQKKQIWAEKEYIERTITTIETGINFAGKARKVLNPIERIQMNRQVLSRLEKVTHASWQPSNISPPFVLQCAESVEPMASIGNLVPMSDEGISISIKSPSVCENAQVEVSFSASVPSKPQFQILYGRSQQILDASQVAELEEDGCYDLFFIPRVAGKHVVEVSLAGVLVAKKEFDVAGKPRYGNKVQPGPDWQGEISAKEGTVTQLQLGGSVTVRWENEEETSHVWGREGVFEIELIPNQNFPNEM